MSRDTRNALIVVGIIIAIVIAIAVPNLLTAIGRDRQKRSLAAIRDVAVIIENAGKRDDALAHTRVPRDGWGHPLYVHIAHGQYAVASAGADHRFNRAKWWSGGGAANDFDCDLVYSDGTFVDYPSGVF